MGKSTTLGGVKRQARKLTATARQIPGKAADAVKGAQGPSPNPMTNLVIADIAIRGGGRLLRHAVETTLLGVKYPPDKARDLVKGRSMAQTLLGTAIARVATRSVPGALLVGTGLLVKTLYDRRKNRKAAHAEGEQDIAEQAARG